MRFQTALQVGALLVDRAAALAERRVSLRQAFGMLLVSVVAAVTILSLVLLVPGSGRTGSAWSDADLDALGPPAPAAVPAPPFYPQGRPPLESPDADSTDQPSGEFVGWAVLDRETGSITGSETMTEVSTTASMIKAWIAADYLRRIDETGREPSTTRMTQLELVIRDSNNEYAQTIFMEIVASESIDRMIDICGLTDSRPYRDFWSNTQLSPRDTARLGACIADGRAAGPTWTEWLLEQMREVRGIGDFGIRHAFPEPERGQIAIKNGWIDRDYDGNWHVNCLAIGDTWTMGVMLRYPVELGYEHGAERCESLAAEHLVQARR